MINKAKKRAQFKDLVNEIEWYKNESSKLTETFELQKREIQMLKSKKKNIVECKLLSSPHRQQQDPKRTSKGYEKTALHPRAHNDPK